MSTNDFDAKSWAFVTASIRLCSEATKMLRQSGTSTEVLSLESAIEHLIAARGMIHARLDG